VHQHSRQGRRLHHAQHKDYTLQPGGVRQWSPEGGVCIAHGARTKLCSIEGCTNGSKKGGVCITHGATKKRCSNEGCANGAVKGGVCVTHGATKKRCSQEGCANMAVKGGVCITHGLNVAARRGAPTEPSGEAFAPRMAQLRNDAATRGASMEPSRGVFASRTAQRRNVAATMGAPTESSGGVCVTHGVRTKHCKSEGCTKQVRKGGLCRRYGPYSIAAAAAQNGAARPSHPAGGYDARSIVASDIAGGGGGGIEIDRRHLQTDVSCATAPRLPSLCPSIMAPNFSDDDEEIIGAWIWRSSRTAKLGGVNNTDGAL